MTHPPAHPAAHKGGTPAEVFSITRAEWDDLQRLQVENVNLRHHNRQLMAERGEKPLRAGLTKLINAARAAAQEEADIYNNDLTGGFSSDYRGPDPVIRVADVTPLMKEGR